MVENLNLSIKYIKHNLYLSIIVLYFIISIILKIHNIIDITIPCLFSKTFGIHCPGCGLTRSFIEIIKFNFKEAWHFNPKIYLILPLSLFFIIQDYRNFKKLSKIN
jgi:hypothetical protein